MRLLLFILLSTSIASAQGLLEDFEDNRFVYYNFVSGVLNQNITNPDMSGLILALTALNTLEIRVKLTIFYRLSLMILLMMLAIMFLEIK